MELQRFYKNIYHESLINGVNENANKLLSLISGDTVSWYFDSLWDAFDEYKEDHDEVKLLTKIKKFSQRFNDEKNIKFIEVTNFLIQEVNKIISYNNALRAMVKPSDKFVEKFRIFDLENSNSKEIKSLYLEMEKTFNEIHERVSAYSNKDKFNYDLTIIERSQLSEISNSFIELLYSKSDVKFDVYSIGSKFHLNPLSKFSVGRINREFGQALCKPSLQLLNAHENDINSSGVTCSDCVKRLIDYSFQK